MVGQNHRTYRPVLPSGEALTAAAIAIALGAPIGLIMGLNKWVKGVFDTPIEFYWPLPPLAYCR